MSWIIIRATLSLESDLSFTMNFILGLRFASGPPGGGPLRYRPGNIPTVFIDWQLDQAYPSVTQPGLTAPASSYQEATATLTGDGTVGRNGDAAGG